MPVDKGMNQKVKKLAHPFIYHLFSLHKYFLNINYAVGTELEVRDRLVNIGNMDAHCMVLTL